MYDLFLDKERLFRTRKEAKGFVFFVRGVREERSIEERFFLLFLFFVVFFFFFSFYLPRSKTGSNVLVRDSFLLALETLVRKFFFEKVIPESLTRCFSVVLTPSPIFTFDISFPKWFI